MLRAVVHDEILNDFVLSHVERQLPDIHRRDIALFCDLGHLLEQLLLFSGLGLRHCLHFHLELAYLSFNCFIDTIEVNCLLSGLIAG